MKSAFFAVFLDSEAFVYDAGINDGYPVKPEFLGKTGKIIFKSLCGVDTEKQGYCVVPYKMYSQTEK